MHLWNDYEGTTLAGRWQLGRLLRTEGRSALFATTKADGQPAILRVTEALNDQAVLQARFRAIQAAGDKYLVAVEGYGDALLDGTPLSYAVLESTQESLADILAQRRLAPDETLEVATSVASGLLALHSRGLVHGLVEPESVLAAGERIKLRSDCARWAPSPEDAALEGAVTAQTDALGLAGTVYRALTQSRLHDSSDALALPEPFATIVRNTARGAWGVPEIQAELERYSRAHVSTVPVTPAATSQPATTLHTAPSMEPKSRVDAPASAEPAPAPLSSRAATTVVPEEDSAWKQPERLDSGLRRGIFAAVGAAALLLILFLAFHHSPKGIATPLQSNSAQVPETTPAALTPPVSPSTMAPAVQPAPGNASALPSASRPATRARDTNPAAAAPSPEAAPSSPLAGQKVWRVIVYTYNHRDQAAARAAQVNRRFPGFDAQVWSRTGERPFLVTLGTGMTEQQASALRARARRAGIARDLYAQNYSH